MKKLTFGIVDGSLRIGVAYGLSCWDLLLSVGKHWYFRPFDRRLIRAPKKEGNT